MDKTVDQMIDETANKLATVINESGLPIAIIRLLLTNALYQLQTIQQQAPAQEEASDAKS